MATIAFYNHTRKLFANNEVNLDSLKLMLLNNHSFDASDDDIADIDGDEVHGSGWDEGGEAISSAAVTTVNTNEAMLDATNLSVLAEGGNIGPSDGAVIYVDESPAFPLFYIDFEGEEEAGVGTNFNVNWNENGIARWLVPA